MQLIKTTCNNHTTAAKLGFISTIFRSLAKQSLKWQKNNDHFRYLTEILFNLHDKKTYDLFPSSCGMSNKVYTKSTRLIQQ